MDSTKQMTIAFFIKVFVTFKTACDHFKTAYKLRLPRWKIMYDNRRATFPWENGTIHLGILFHLLLAWYSFFGFDPFSFLHSVK